MSQRQDNSSGFDSGDGIPFAKFPIRSPVMTVEPQWIDYNGHLNLAYYQVLFDRATDGVFAELHIGRDYAAEQGRSMFAIEAHISYLREIGEGEQVFIDSQILDHDEKRLHIFQTLMQAGGDFVSATCEIMHLHIDMVARKVTPFPADRMQAIAACATAHADLPVPERAGRHIGIPRP